METSPKTSEQHGNPFAPPTLAAVSKPDRSRTAGTVYVAGLAIAICLSIGAAGRIISTWNVASPADIMGAIEQVSASVGILAFGTASCVVLGLVHADARVADSNISFNCGLVVVAASAMLGRLATEALPTWNPTLASCTLTLSATASMLFVLHRLHSRSPSSYEADPPPHLARTADSNGIA